jgi:hypothetical protein
MFQAPHLRPTGAVGMLSRDGMCAGASNLSTIEMPVSQAFLQFRKFPSRDAAVLGNARDFMPARGGTRRAEGACEAPDTRFLNVEDVFFLSTVVIEMQCLRFA